MSKHCHISKVLRGGVSFGNSLLFCLFNEKSLSIIIFIQFAHLLSILNVIKTNNNNNNINIK